MGGTKAKARMRELMGERSMAATKENTGLKLVKSVKLLFVNLVRSTNGKVSCVFSCFLSVSSLNCCKHSNQPWTVAS